MNAEEVKSEEAVECITENDAECTPPEDGSEEVAEPGEEEPSQSEENETRIDYEALAREDVSSLKREFAELSALSSILELDNPTRYGELRDLGLSPREAYLATRTRGKEKTVVYDNRSHLRSAIPKSHGGGIDTMGIGELREARELFAGMSDAEIIRLYKKVNS